MKLEKYFHLFLIVLSLVLLLETVLFEIRRFQEGTNYVIGTLAIIGWILIVSDIICRGAGYRKIWKLFKRLLEMIINKPKN